MFYDQSQSVREHGELFPALARPSGHRTEHGVGACDDEGGFPAPAFAQASEEAADGTALETTGDTTARIWEVRGGATLFSGYEREVITRIWEFAEAVPGVDPELWRRDEFGAWIRRLDYGRRDSAFGWEIFDPGIGRSSQGVYAMRPMHWQSYLRQHEAFL